MNEREYNERRAALMNKSKQAILDGDSKAAEEANAEVEALDAQYAVIKANAQALDVQSVHDISNYSRTTNGGGKDFGIMNTEVTSIRDLVATDEYRNAWLKKLKGEQLTASEIQAVTSANGAIPTITANEVIRKAEMESPLLQEINLLHIPGDIKIAVEDDPDEAALHAENGSVTESTDGTHWINLVGYEIIKLIRISAKVAKMAIPAFEDWLTTQLAESIAAKANKYIASGTGTNQPKGMANIRTWTENESLITWTGDYPTYKELCKLCALVKGKSAGKKWFMSEATWWGSIMPHRNDAQYKDAIKEDGAGGYRLNNYPVVFCDEFADNEIYFGNLKRAITGNMGDDVEVAVSTESGFTTNSVIYRGTCIFDCTAAVPSALAKSTVAAGGES